MDRKRPKCSALIVEDEPEEVVRYICADCSICFQTEADIRQHLRDVHDKRDGATGEDAEQEERVGNDYVSTEQSEILDQVDSLPQHEFQPLLKQQTPPLDPAEAVVLCSNSENLPRTVDHLSSWGQEEEQEEETSSELPVKEPVCSNEPTPRSLVATSKTSSSRQMLRAGAACHICLKWLSSTATLRSHVRACQAVSIFASRSRFKVMREY